MLRGRRDACWEPGGRHPLLFEPAAVGHARRKSSDRGHSLPEALCKPAGAGSNARPLNSEARGLFWGGGDSLEVHPDLTTTERAAQFK